MTLGAQLFSLRDFLKTPEDMKETFRKVKEIGYENVQFSGAPTTDPDAIREASETAGLPIVLTHVALKRILNETDAVIEEHKKFGCPVIGLGTMTKEAFAIPEEARKLIANLREPVAKIEAAGLHFAYEYHP